MGWRFHKSVNFGSFRVNFSKSGIGYSVGVPGFRYTVMANGKERITVSLPGTGISYVEEYGRKSKDISEHEKAVNEGRFHEVKNQSINNLQSKEYEEFIAQCQQYLDLDKLYSNGIKYSLIVLCCFLFLALIKVYPFITWTISVVLLLSTIYFVLCRKNLYNRRIRLEYSFEDEPNPYTKTKELMRLLEKSAVLRCVKGITTGVERRVHAGATELYDLHNISISKKIPKLIDTNIDCYYVKFPKEELYILPDKILLIANYKIAAINPKSLDIKYETTSFRETSKVPSDAKIVGHSWLYVNNNGMPDKRYNNNREIPICQYGIITIKTKRGLNIVLLGSDDNSFRRFYDKWYSLNSGKTKDSANLKKPAVPTIKQPLELSDEEIYKRRELFSSMIPLQEMYDELVTELANQKEHFSENEQNFLHTIISKGYVTENISSTFSIYDYNINLMAKSEIQKMFSDLRERYLGIVNAYEKYEHECISYESKLNINMKEKNLNSTDCNSILHMTDFVNTDNSTIDLNNQRDKFFEEAGRFVIEKDKASIGMLQRIFKIGFNRASLIMDQLAVAGVVGEENGTKPREVLMSMQEFENYLENN